MIPKLTDRLRARIETHKAELKPGRKAYHERELKRCEAALSLLEELDAPRVHAKAVATMTKLATRVQSPNGKRHGSGPPLATRIVAVLQASPEPMVVPEIVSALQAQGWTTTSPNPVGMLNVTMSKVPGIKHGPKKQVGSRRLNTWTAAKEKTGAATRA